jgi:hypothetical protein
VGNKGFAFHLCDLIKEFDFDFIRLLIAVLLVRS